MPALDEVLQQKMLDLASNQQVRVFTPNTRAQELQLWRGGKRLVSFSCNDYLGLSRHPDVIAAAMQALHAQGAGAGASRAVTGNYGAYAELEAALARMKATQAACVFGSGYLANIGAIPALVGKGDIILADKLIHASMIDGAMLSGAKLLRFAHNDVDHCEQMLQLHRTHYRHCLLLTETIFSMDGDAAPMQALKSIAARHDAWLMSDDAHGLGVVPHAACAADVQLGTLSKAAGSYGGYVCGSALLIDTIKTSARSLIFSTALPPASVAASIASLRIIEASPELVRLPLAHAQFFAALLELPEAQSAIVPLILGSNARALHAQKLLEEAGFFVAAIRPPTVPEDTARLRFAFSALHTRAQIDALASVVKAQGLLCAP